MIMINNELKRLSRRELVDVIYQLKKNEDEMKEKIESLEKELSDKRIHLSVAGSVAEAATGITDIFATAQATADLYLHEISCMKADTERECAKKIEETERKVEKILSDGKEIYEKLIADYQRDYRKWQQLKSEMQESAD